MGVLKGVLICVFSVYYYMLLLGFLSLKITPRRLYCLVFLTTGMAWIHALTFLGLGVALIITGCLSLLLSKQYNIKQKLIVRKGSELSARSESITGIDVIETNVFAFNAFLGPSEEMLFHFHDSRSFP